MIWLADVRGEKLNLENVLLNYTVKGWIATNLGVWMIVFDLNKLWAYIWQIVWFIRYWGVMHQIRSFEEIILQRTLIRSFKNLISRACYCIIVLQISHCSQRDLWTCMVYQWWCCLWFCECVFFSGQSRPWYVHVRLSPAVWVLVVRMWENNSRNCLENDRQCSKPHYAFFFSQKGNWLTSSSKNWRTLWGLLVSCLLFILFSLSEVRAFEKKLRDFRKKWINTNVQKFVITLAVTIPSTRILLYEHCYV